MADHIDTSVDQLIGGVETNTPLRITNGRAASSSDSSGDTLQDDVSSDARSNGNGALSTSSPISADNLNFHNLAISSGSSRFHKGGAERYSNPFQRGAKLYNDSSPYQVAPRDSVRKDGNFRMGTSYNSRAGTAGYRNSRTWMSPDAQANQEFMVIRNSMRRLFKNSDVSKWKLTDYIAHREAMIASQATKLASQVMEKEGARVRSTSIPPETQHNLRRWGLEGNFDEHGNFGRVLGEQTIWCDDWENGKDEIAPWPSMAEMKWEGDDRAKTGVGRFLPLPREQGPPTLAWNQLPVVDQYPIDQVARIPTMEDIYLPIDDQIESDNEYLWSKDLERDMDAFLGS